MTTSAGAVVLTGWGRAVDAPATVLTEHAIDPAAADPHTAVCGAPAAVVDRRRPWSGADGESCAACLSALVHQAA
jgi:hypothetical protein